MRTRLLVAAGLLCSASFAAHADTLSLGSFATGSPAPGGVANTSVAYNGSGATYNVGTSGIWHAPLDNSSWVSFNPGTSASPSYTAPAGTYMYSTTFQATSDSSGTIYVLADDTTSIDLNGHEIALPGSGQSAHCTTTVPNCLTVASYDLPTDFFLDGTNTLTFDVQQLYQYGTGLDFNGTVQTGVTPEPSSFLLLGTGLLGAAGILKKRYIA